MRSTDLRRLLDELDAADVGLVLSPDGLGVVLQRLKGKVFEGDLRHRVTVLKADLVDEIKRRASDNAIALELYLRDLETLPCSLGLRSRAGVYSRRMPSDLLALDQAYKGKRLHSVLRDLDLVLVSVDEVAP